MKRVKIPGSKFDLSLEDNQNQWFLRLRLGDAIEEEKLLTHVDKRAIRDNITELLDSVQLHLNEIQINMLHSEFWTFIDDYLTEQKRQKQLRFGTIKDPRIGDATKRIEQLISKIDALEVKLSELELRLN